MENEETFRFVKKDGQEIHVGSLGDKRKVVIVINNQITFAPNTTQIASGAGRNSAAGSNAAIDSSNTSSSKRSRWRRSDELKGSLRKLFRC